MNIQYYYYRYCYHNNFRRTEGCYWVGSWRVLNVRQVNPWCTLDAKKHFGTGEWNKLAFLEALGWGPAEEVVVWGSQLRGDSHDPKWKPYKGEEVSLSLVLPSWDLKGSGFTMPFIMATCSEVKARRPEDKTDWGRRHCLEPWEKRVYLSFTVVWW